MPTLRLLSYNIRSLRDDKAAVARIIREANPHVVCIQEAPRFFRWRASAAALARATNLVVVGGGRPAGATVLLFVLAVDVKERARPQVRRGRPPSRARHGDRGDVAGRPGWPSRVRAWTLVARKRHDEVAGGEGR